MIKNGSSIEEIVNFVEENKRRIIHAIVVDDLNHLKRGGRISGTVATVGALLGIKPTLKIDDEGKVIPGDKIKGRKKALKYLVQELKEKAINPEEQVIFICHADCLSEAEDVKKMILEEVKVKDVLINS
ncbi:DegV family protein, partial [Clostridium perfringens]|uniref:DegV family protein n=3 Tax=Clostridium TaxID=1485 RepID=UPI002ACC20C4